MAFNFNWSPLTADASFYKRARDLLTTALNKSPKPPIIVDDILVTEFNLGSVPPELEILEIGDLAEDRFRGIFKMCYSGDAFLTLKTRVQVCFYEIFLSGDKLFSGAPFFFFFFSFTQLQHNSNSNSNSNPARYLPLSEISDSIVESVDVLRLFARGLWSTQGVCNLCQISLFPPVISGKRRG
jgi:hypothetical protein